MDALTVIKSYKPDKVCKTYALDASGKIQKRAVANISEGRAKQIGVPDAEKFITLLKLVTERQDLVLCTGVWRESQVGQDFGIITEKALCDLLGDEIGKVQGGVIDHQGQLISARLARGIDYSNWLLLDADNPAGIPFDWAEMGIADRLQLWEPFVPGISRCERIEARSSSARVVKDDDTPGERSHAWIRVSDPDKIPILKAHIQVQMVLHDASFTFERRSRSDRQKVIGSEHRSVFDLAVFDKGRLVFCARPEVSAEGYGVVDADITLVNQGGGQLDLSSFSLPLASDLGRHQARTQQNLAFTLAGTGVQTVEAGLLTLETEIEVKGIVRPFSGWVSGLSSGDKIRCEAPFRESQSEAAFIRLPEFGAPFVYDIGNATKYILAKPSVGESNLNSSAQIDPNNAVQFSAPIDPLTEVQKAFCMFCFDSQLRIGVRKEIADIMAGQRDADINMYKLAEGKILMRAHLETLPISCVSKKVAEEFPVNPRTLRYDEVAFTPTATPKTTLNYWVPPNVEPVAGDWSVIETFLLNIICDRDRTLFDYLIKFLAHMWQKPEEKPGILIVLLGGQGSGKGTLFNLLQSIWSRTTLHVSDVEHVTGGFNGAMERNYIVNMDEALFSGDRRSMDRLKSMITEPKITIEQKYQPRRTIQSLHRFFAASNHDHFGNIELDDRRFVFLRVSDKRKGNHDYFDELYAAINDPVQLGAFVHKLATLDITDFNSRAKPNTSELLEQKLQSLRGFARYWYEVLSTGYIDCAR